jgi:hypothetical protein
MSIFTAPFKDPNYIFLNQKEHDLINPNKQQGCDTLGYFYCMVCSKPLKYKNQQLCHTCKAYLVRGQLFPQHIGNLEIIGDEYKKYYPQVTNELVNQINIIMDGKFKTRTYKAKTAKMLCAIDKFFKAQGEIETDVAYRRLRYYADTSKRDSLQRTLQSGKKLFDFLFSIKIYKRYYKQ